jgi:CHAT domain-containing protein
MFKRFYLSIKHRWLGILCLISLSLCLWMGHIPLANKSVEFGQAVNAQTPAASQQMQQGIDRYQAQDYPGAIALWQQVLKTTNNSPANTAILRENLARAYQQMGQFDRAIAYWQPTIDYYRQIGDRSTVGRLLTEQAQAYLHLGQPRPAIALLCGKARPSSDLDCDAGTALQIARQQRDRPAEVAALGSLGEAHRLRGDNELAIAFLHKAQEIAPDRYTCAISNSLGNAYAAIARRQSLTATSARQRGNDITARRFENKARENTQNAQLAFQNSLEIAIQQENIEGEMRSLLNSIALASRSPTLNPGRDRAVDRALGLWDRLPASPDKVYAAIELASLPAASERLTAPLAQCPVQRYLSNVRAQNLLEQSIILARTLQNSRVESFALGALGHFYECQQQYPKALQLTQEALQTTATSLSDRDSAYLWEWQQGRIFRAQADTLQQQGKITEAQAQRIDQISAFQRSYILLEAVRGDILGSERDIQFDFRDAIEPIYRQLAQLRLKLASQTPLDRQTREQELTRALETIDSLRLAELQNYFGSDCLDALVSEGTIEPSIRDRTAVFSTIILEDSTAILLSLPNGDKRVHWVERDRPTVEREIKAFWDGLIRGIEDLERYDTTQSQKLYDWLIRDFEPDLASANITTLVFIQDGLLRTVPMAALYDGQAYLVEKYAIATTPSLRAIVPQKSDVKDKKALILGLTEETEIDGQPFSALPNVPFEIDSVQSQFPSHQSLIDDRFDRESIEQELNRSTYPIIHIATHAQFGFTPEDTFLVAGNGDKITLTQLEAALRTVNGGANAVALLTLSACQTAAGDERAALGLAGVALQTGVQSALASLWSVGDESTAQLIAEFYRGTSELGLSKAEALKLAQLKLIHAGKEPDVDDRYDNPAYWSPFILVGNWL